MRRVVPDVDVGSVLAPVFALGFVVLIVTAPTAAGAAEPGTDRGAGNARPEIVALYPNPVAEDDAGEFVVVRFPTETDLSEWSLEDGETTAPLPNATVSGRVAFSDDPRVVRNRTGGRVLALADDLALANDGETVRLTRRVGADPTSSVSYADAPEGERWAHAPEGWRWRPLGATDFDVARAGPSNATAFVLPDAPGVPVEALREADRRILLAGYTFASGRVADALAAAARRGVSVRVLVDGGPVGGITLREAHVLDSLVARGVDVRVLGGPLARYGYHHAKYAVADGSALVLTENWKPAGTGGRGSRGWGVRLDGSAAVDRLAAVFEADAGWRDATSWSEFRRGRSFRAEPPANGSYPTRTGPKRVTVSRSEVLVAPDNAERGLVALLDSANESIRVQQVAVGGRRQPFLRATLRAARRGVDVRVLLSSEWYVAEENRALAERLNDRAERENLPFEVRLADPRGRYEKVHTKGVIVDDEAAVVGSLNWNNHSARQNREVAVVLHGEAVAKYYAEVFDSDWRASANGPVGRVPVGLLAVVAAGALAAVLLANREVNFEEKG